MNPVRRRWIIFRGWWTRFKIRHGKKTWMQREFERGDPDGIVRAFSDQVIKEIDGGVPGRETTGTGWF